MRQRTLSRRRLAYKSPMTSNDEGVGSEGQSLVVFPPTVVYTTSRSDMDIYCNYVTHPPKPTLLFVREMMYFDARFLMPFAPFVTSARSGTSGPSTPCITRCGRQSCMHRNRRVVETVQMLFITVDTYTHSPVASALQREGQ